MLDWSLANDTFCTVGPKHLSFWDTAGTVKRGAFGNAAKVTNLLCVTFDEQGIAYTGAQTGEIMKWANGSLRSSHMVHKGVIHCIKYLNDQTTRVLLTGSTDLSVKITNPDTMDLITAI